MYSQNMKFKKKKTINLLLSSSYILIQFPTANECDMLGKKDNTSTQELAIECDLSLPCWQTAISYNNSQVSRSSYK